jgi:hypothetical protein
MVIRGIGVNRMIVTVLAATAVTAFSVPTFTALGWTKARINGQTYTKSLGHELPANWFCSVQLGSKTQTSGNAPTGLRANQVGTDRKVEEGDITFQYRVVQGVSSSSQTTWFALITKTFMASAEGDVFVPGCTGSSSAKVGAASIAITYGPQTTNQSKTVGPLSSKKWYKLPPLSWNPHPNQGGLYEAIFHSTSPLHKANSKVTNPADTGDMQAIMGLGSATYTYHPTSLAYKLPESSAGWFEGTTNVLGDQDLDADVYNAYNAPLERTGSNVVNGEWAMNFGYMEFKSGEYRIYFYSRGTLRKRIDIEWNNDLGLAGLHVELLYGDLDGDNFISQEEVDYIFASIGKHEGMGEAFYWDDDNPWCPYDCDFNLDGSVTVADYLLAASNAGKKGD